MRVLIIGGTQFIGRHIVESLLAARHAVSILNRGKSPDDLPAGVQRFRGDRDAGAVPAAADCHRRARSSGLTLTAPEVTLREVRAWLCDKNATPPLSPDRESELIGIAREKRKA